MLEWRRHHGDHGLQVESLTESRGRVAIVFSWRDAKGERHEWAHLLKLRDGVIVDMQDYASAEAAQRALRRRFSLG